jgi:hypothetical protein
MQQTPTTIAVDLFILDGRKIALRLDSVSTRDSRETLLAEVGAGQVAYRALLKRREAMTVSSPNESLIQMMLDGLAARLRFLESRAG